MKWKLSVIFVLAIFVRLYLLDSSTHFLSDESRDLVNIHQIFVEKKLTLVGPISDDRSHVFSSLTYYMLLPFAVLFKFDPIGTVVGAAFWGIVTWGVVVAVSSRFNQKGILAVALAAALWFPLVQTSRWPWNPNLMLFWLFAGLYLSTFKHPIWRLATGAFLGLAIHHHYLALVPLALMFLKKRDILYIVGSFIVLVPFAIFDFMHPPGIFISRMIDYNRGQMGTNPVDLIMKMPNVLRYFMEYVFQQKIVVYAGSFVVLGLLTWDFFRKSQGRSWAVIWILTLLPLGMYSQQFHYLLPAIPFFMMWMISPRSGQGTKLAKAVLMLIVVGSMSVLFTHWRQADWEGDLRVLRGASKIIQQEITNHKMINANLAVLSSPDIYPMGKRYRDLLLVNDIRLRTYEEFELSDNLFVITKGTLSDLRKDPASELIYFRNGPVAGEWNIPNSKWKVIQLNRY